MDALSAKNTIYLVTGVSGFIGLEIAEQLCKRGYTVRGLVRSTKSVPYPKEMELVKGDILESESLERLYHDSEGKRTVMIHSAAFISVRKKDIKCENINIQGTLNVIEICKKHYSRLVYISSVDTLPHIQGKLTVDPTDYPIDIHKTSYAYSKAVASKLVQNSDLDRIILLPSAVAGPNDYRKGFISDLLEVYINGITLFSIKGGYDFVDVRDVAKATVNACNADTKQISYILSNRYADITKIYSMLADHLKINKPKILLPLWSLYPFIPFMWLWCKIKKKECPLTAQAIKIMGKQPVYSSESAKKDLGFDPRPLDETFKDTVDFLLRQKKSK
jgi:dihydroflavonol-4-reductase